MYIDYKKEPIKDFESYQIDTDGVVYSKRGSPIKWSVNPHGYACLTLMKNGEPHYFSAHQLVAKQFIPNDDPLKWQVNHKDGNKLNNQVTNLEWVTPVENMRHAIDILGRNKGRLHPHAIKIQRENIQIGTYEEFDCLSDAARIIAKENHIKMKSAKMSIWKALNGYLKTYKNYIWTYVTKSC